MKVIQASVNLHPQNPTGERLLEVIEDCARTCYQSEPKGREARDNLIQRCIRRGHVSVIEHGAITAIFIIDRGISHELVRHRLCAFSQESTRYCRYAHGIEVVEPIALRGKEEEEDYLIWHNACHEAETWYLRLIKKGMLPQIARAVLPTCLKTQICVTTNPREWRHIFHLRTSVAAHPDMQDIMKKALTLFQERYPILFEDIS